MLHAANCIDPAINFQTLKWGAFGSNVPERQPVVDAYGSVARLVGDNKFSDVVLLPFLVRGGADKYLLQVINGISQLMPSRRFLIIFGQEIARHDWLDRLPPSSLIVDLYSLCPALSDSDRELIALRLIHTAASTAELHVKACKFSVNFINRKIKRT